MQRVGWYEQLSHSRLNLREDQWFRSTRQLPELEVQARWFSGEFGTEFVTTCGERVKVLQPGIWNREAGPDFVEAAISVNGGPPVRGAIELDPEVRDWERHGHATNPEYESVVLHLFWKKPQQEVFTRTAGNRCVPQVLLELGELEDIPVSTQPLAKPGRCSSVLRRLPENEIRQIIEAASRFRLGKKAARLSRLSEIHGSDEAIYQALAITLGYKSNKLPFALLSQRLSLGLLHKHRADADALLFGVAGFIDSTDLSGFCPETRMYVRGLWERWWTRRIEFRRVTLTKGQWSLNGLRPANDPHRRIAALLEITRHWPQIRALSKRCEVARIRSFFSGLHDEFWDFHYSFGSKRSKRAMALVGSSRVDEMLANVFFPFAINSIDSLWETYVQLPASLSNRRVRIASIRLFGSDGPGIPESLSNQQGLLQIFEDFCLRDSSNCADCPFPEQCIQLPKGM